MHSVWHIFYIYYLYAYITGSVGFVLVFAIVFHRIYLYISDIYTYTTDMHSVCVSSQAWWCLTTSPSHLESCSSTAGTSMDFTVDLGTWPEEVCSLMLFRSIFPFCILPLFAFSLPTAFYLCSYFLSHCILTLFIFSFRTLSQVSESWPLHTPLSTHLKVRRSLMRCMVSHMHSSWRIR